MSGLFLIKDRALSTHEVTKDEEMACIIRPGHDLANDSCGLWNHR